MNGVCINCKRTLGIHARGLCRRCFDTPAIRAKHQKKFNPKRPKDPEDPTEEELDRMIAEQLPTMPPKDQADEPVRSLAETIAQSGAYRRMFKSRCARTLWKPL